MFWCEFCNTDHGSEKCPWDLLQAERKRHEETKEELSMLEEMFEAIDEAGLALAEHEGKPYDRMTCWGEPALDLAERIAGVVRRAVLAENRVDELEAIIRRAAKNL